LTQESSAKGNDSELETYFRAIKSWKKKWLVIIGISTTFLG
jgi:hypothetical protein